MAALRTLYKSNYNIKYKQFEPFINSSFLKHRNITLQSTKLQTATVTPEQFNISFADYQKLKRNLKTKQRIAGIPFALTGMLGSSMATAYLMPDMFDATPENVQLIMGMDPLMFCGICGVAASGISYVLGTNIFKMLWNTMNKEESSNLQARDADFLKRLEQFRYGGDSRFEDDYYGESIKTLSDYRQWIRTHQRKRETIEKFDLTKVKKEQEVVS